MNITAIALDEKNINSTQPPPAPLRTSLLRPEFGKIVSESELGLEPAPPAPLNYKVQRGDNLWTICRDCLRDLGQSPSKSELYRLVQEVSKANNLRNPDFLQVGQTLDLSSAREATSPPPAAPVIAKASPPPSANAETTLLATSSIKTFSAHSTPPVTPVIPNGDKFAKAGVAPVSNAAGGSSAAMLAASQQAVGARAAMAAFGGPDLRVLGTTPPLIPSDSVERTHVASLPGSSGVPVPESKRPNIRSLMEKIGLGSKEARIGMGLPWRKMLDGAARITSGFGVRSDPFTGRLQHHTGIDIAAKRGTRIFPMEDGEVTFAGWKGGYGRMVSVMHDDGLESTYGHNSKNLVKVGDRVTADTPLALVGSTGRSTGPHIHFEVRENGRPVDPLPLLEERSIKISEAL